MLYAHCAEIDQAAQNRLEILLQRLMERHGATEDLKARDPMGWVGLMNSLRVQVEEVIQVELV